MLKTIIAIVVMCLAQLGGSAMAEQAGIEKATFAGGCFWCMQHAFDAIPGVVTTQVGFTGGETKNPTYEAVSAGQTGHAEAILIEFDPKQITYQQLLTLYWHNVDPTTKDRQFCDVGNQYRTAIFYHNKEQEQLAEVSKQALIDSKKFTKITTEIVPAAKFYLAEEYHQSYHKKNPYRYKVYRYSCGRDQRLQELWKK